MIDINIWALAGTGLFAGFFGAMLGIGGGVFIVPILTLAIGLPMQVAIGSSLISIVINACTATSVYIREHMTNIKLGLLLATTLVPGAIVGGILAANLASPALSVIFGLVMIYVAYTLIPKKQRKKNAPASGDRPKTIKEKKHASHAWLDGCYHDPAVNEDVTYQVHRPLTGMVAGFFGGVISSLLGVGGGLINVPVMSGVMKMPIKATIATSSLLLCITTMTGSLIYAHNGFIHPYVVAPLVVSVYVGARLGATFAHRTRGALLIRIFIVFLILTSILMIAKALFTTGNK